jgi:antitoxin component YwqK of YwqJK toxin-antitoxin module
MMPIVRSYHANGCVRSEVTLVDDVPHGITRHWHENGQLKSEIPVEHGKVHGIVKEWNSKGELVGSFEMIHGSGKSYAWYPDGPVLAVVEYRDGVPHGIQVTYDTDGTEIKRDYWLNGRQVSKKVYDRSQIN